MSDAKDLVILSDQLLVQLIKTPEYQQIFPMFKAYNAQYTTTRGCKCNSGQRKRTTLEQLKSYILELPGEQKAKLRDMIGANKLRISGKQHGRPVIVTIQ